MRRITTILLLLITVVVQAQIQENIVRMETRTTPFLVKYYPKQLVRIANEYPLYRLTHATLVGQSMKTVIDSGWYNVVANVPALDTVAPYYVVAMRDSTTMLPTKYPLAALLKGANVVQDTTGDSYWEEKAGVVALKDTTNSVTIKSGNGTSRGEAVYGNDYTYQGVRMFEAMRAPADSAEADSLIRSSRSGTGSYFAGVESNVMGWTTLIELYNGKTSMVGFTSPMNGLSGALYGYSSHNAGNRLNLGSSSYRWGNTYVTSLDASSAVIGKSTSTGSAIFGQHTGISTTGAGIYGTSVAGHGGYFLSNAGVGVLATSNTGYQFQFGNDKNSSYDSSMVMLANGNVGIGVTNRTPLSKLHVAGEIRATGGTSSDWNTAYAWGNHATAGYLTSQTSHADVVVDGDFTSTGLMKRGATSGTYSIVTDNSSNWNTAYGWGNHASAGYLTDPTTDQGDMIVRGVSGVVRLATPDDDGAVLTVESSYPTWKAPAWTYSGSDIYSLPAKRVSVGTGTPTRLFNVFGAARSDTAQTPLVLGGSNVSSSLTLKSTSATGSSDYIAFVTGGGSERVRVTSGGNVGIGTTAPANELDVVGTASVSSAVISPFFRRTSGNVYIQGEDDVAIICDYNNNDAGTRAIVFGTNTGVTPTGTEILGYWKETGNLGIGTTAPAAKLHLKDGAIRAGVTAYTQIDSTLIAVRKTVYTPVNTGEITAGTGITAAMLGQSMYYNGTAAVDITANPQIADGTDGEEITIVGLSDTNLLTLDDGTGLQLQNGNSFTLGSGDVIKLKYIATLDVWIELQRSNN